jgi:hypothetical protein
VLPGDAGAARVYRPEHPHLPAQRSAPADPRAARMAGAWIAEQVTHLLTGENGLLRGILLHADLDTGEMTENPL